MPTISARYALLDFEAGKFETVQLLSREQLATLALGDTDIRAALRYLRPNEAAHIGHVAIVRLPDFD